jgi:hypothetical protein
MVQKCRKHLFSARWIEKHAFQESSCRLVCFDIILNTVLPPSSFKISSKNATGKQTSYHILTTFFVIVIVISNSSSSNYYYLLLLVLVLVLGGRGALVTRSCKVSLRLPLRNLAETSKKQSSKKTRRILEETSQILATQGCAQYYCSYSS